jgi:hypothetical protein
MNYFPALFYVLTSTQIKCMNKTLMEEKINNKREYPRHVPETSMVEVQYFKNDICRIHLQLMLVLNLTIDTHI